MTLILFILILGVVIFVHELGHFLFAKKCGIYVHEFAIGMGPRIFSKKGKNNETVYSLRLIPIGGFCSLAGEGVEEDRKLPKDRLLQSKSVWDRFLTMFFGPGFNFLFAILLLFLIGLIWGAPNYKPVIADVTNQSAAYEVGIESGDTILEVNEHHIYTTDDLSLYLTLAKKDRPTEILVKKTNGEEKTYHVTPKETEIDGEKQYQYGITLQSTRQRGLLSSIKFTFVKTGALFRQMFVTIQNLFTGGLKVSQLSGPVGIYTIVGEQSKAGVANILYLIAYLSINVGFINLIPLPAFDGGRILFLIIEKIKGSPLKQETENMIHTIGFFLLMALMVYITFNDILKLF